jgi:hypothetical protein
MQIVKMEGDSSAISGGTSCGSSVVESWLAIKRFVKSARLQGRCVSECVCVCVCVCGL